MGHARTTTARRAWRKAFGLAAETFAQQVESAERFPGLVNAPWLDPYAAESSAEFFAVLVEAYFVNPQRVELEFPSLMPWLDAFFRPVRN
jgi:MtfA peptidase